KPAGERVAAVGRFFLETPYVAYTLEAPGPERLQVNLHGLDCTTLVENALALSRLVVSKTQDFETYKALLTNIRYRDGKLDGYPSRLHYASDWLIGNAQKGYLMFVHLGYKTSTLHPQVNFMSTHPAAYSALKADSSLIPAIIAQEVRINQLSFPYLPKEKLTDQATNIRTGDLIAITTGFAGLDFSHLGIAIRQKGKVYLLHASSTGKKVLISEKPLSEYLADIKKHTGIVVVRPL
ncbi:MAG: DUF1460 domain-containing protein, partial [Bacteroidia bacterium]|nr:DUF1460 domain-containing protein [Bacteroidia bacterium]